jgi:drug/metabolite transporter (DMT)-like permease
VARAGPSARDWALFIFCVLNWGSAYALVRVALHHGATPPLVACVRLWLAALLLHAILFARRRAGLEPAPMKGATAKLIAMGVLGAAAPFFLFSLAQTWLSSGLVAIYAALTPLMVTGLAPLVAPEDRLTAHKLLGVGLGFVGVIVLIGPDALAGAVNANLLGQLIAIAAATAYAVNTLIARGGVQIPATEGAAGWTFYGALCSTPFAVLSLAAGAHLDIVAWITLGALAIGATGLAGIAYFHLIRSAGPVFVTQTNYVIPLWALALGAMLFGERIPPQALLALALIAAGLFVAQDGWRALQRLA